MGKKLYPFSVEKHAHDIEFRRNRVKNLIDDYTVGGKPCSDEKFDSLIELDEKLDDLLSAVLSSSDGRIAWLTGEQIGLAKETVAWAYLERSRPKKR